MSPHAGWFREQGDSVLIFCRIQPRASKTQVVGVVAGASGQPSRLKVRVSAPPVDQGANEALVEFLAEKLGLAKSSIQLASGHTSREKSLLIRNCDLVRLNQLLSPKP